MTSRSWVDAITNESMLAGLDAGEYRAWLHDRSVTANPVVPVFLHEFTHHWCFDSLVGTTLAGLYMGARERAFLGDLSRREVASAVADDLIRYWAASYLLRPLSEGIALFAEYDFRPGKAKTMSPLYQAVLACFGIPSRNQGEHSEIVADTLQLARRVPHFCDRKADLLAKPAQPDDGYLLGYLAVKALWNNARGRCELLEDAELFLSFLRSWFYLDAGLVNAVLDPVVHGVDVANAIADRVRQRINTFLTCDLNRTVHEWRAGDRQGGYGMYAGLHISNNDLDRANALLQRVLDEHLDHVPNLSGDQISEAVKALRINTLYDRSTFSVCESETQSILFSSGEMMLSIWDTRAGEASEVANWGGCSPEIKARLRAHAQFTKVRRSIGSMLESSFQKAIRRPAFDIWRWHLQDSGRSVIAEIWEQTATIHLSEEIRALVIPRLRQRGILTLLKGDVDNLTAIAAIGIANTFSMRRSDVHFLASALGLEHEQVELAEREAHSVHGMPILLRQGDFLIALV